MKRAQGLAMQTLVAALAIALIEIGVWAAFRQREAAHQALGRALASRDAIALAESAAEEAVELLRAGAIDRIGAEGTLEPAETRRLHEGTGDGDLALDAVRVRSLGAPKQGPAMVEVSARAYRRTGAFSANALGRTVVRRYRCDTYEVKAGDSVVFSQRRLSPVPLAQWVK
jgi:hypothetical protein